MVGNGYLVYVIFHIQSGLSLVWLGYHGIIAFGKAAYYAVAADKKGRYNCYDHHREVFFAFSLEIGTISITSCRNSIYLHTCMELNRCSMSTKKKTWRRPVE